MTSCRFFDSTIRRARHRALAALLASAAVAVGGVALALGAIGRTAARTDAAAAAVVEPGGPANDAATGARPLPTVVSAVRAAEGGRPFPSGLTPAIDNLLDDFYVLPKGCTPPAKATRSEICRLGDTRSRKTIVVFGDSHGQMWMPAILAMAQRDGWSVIPLVKVGCIPRVWTASGDCATWYRWAKRQAEALRPDVTLIVGSRSGTYNPSASIRPVIALSTSMKRFSRRVIVVGDAPNQTREPVDCLLAPGSTMKTCTVESKSSQFRTEATIESMARADGVGFIGTWSWFCARVSASTTAYLCPLVVNGMITARDRGHITATYGFGLKAAFRSAFRRELSG